MINVTAKLGTLGNNMWQYSVSRVIAEKNNLQLNCYSIPKFQEPKMLYLAILMDHLVNMRGYFLIKSYLLLTLGLK